MQGSLQAFQSDQAAAENLYGMGAQALGTQSQIAQASSDVGQNMMRAMQDSQNWGRQQFNEIWPYARDYLSSQQSLSNLAGENASESVIAAREGRQRAEDIYRRYNAEFAPIEDQIAQEARDYNSPARAAQASGQAQAAVRTASDAEMARRQAELRGYGIDPSQARYQGESALAGLGSAAAQAGAGTASRLASEQEGNRRLLAAAQLGQTLPTQALNQLSLATQGANSALQAGQVGGQGLNAATGVFGAGTTAGGSPVAYGYMANPYTQLNATQAGLGSQLYGHGTSALGNMSNVIGASTTAQNTAFTNQMSEFNANAAQDAAMWGGVGKALGGIGSLALAPVTGGGSLFGNFATKALQ
jgi:hypothetical protein